MIKLGKHHQPTMTSRLPFYLKSGAVLLLLSLSFLLIACGTGNTTTTANLNSPPVTVTIRFNNNLSSPETVRSYLCGAWTHDTTPGFSPGSEIPIYAHFVHNVNGNPVGVNGASAQASVQWADGSRDNQAGTTTGDGLVVFYFTIPNRPDMIGKNNLVIVSFTAPSGQTCNIDNQSQPAAFFTLIGVSPTPTATPSVMPQSTRSILPLDITPPAFLSPGRNNQAIATPHSASGFPSGF